MYSVQLDKDGYFTGAYAEIGFVVDGVETAALPPDMTKATCYKLDHGEWIFDPEKWTIIQTERELDILRTKRNEAFALLDKYQLVLVYETLTSEQKEELIKYRQDLLDATKTLTIPEKPEWLN